MQQVPKEGVGTDFLLMSWLFRSFDETEKTLSLVDNQRGLSILEKRLQQKQRRLQKLPKTLS